MQQKIQSMFTPKRAFGTKKYQPTRPEKMRNMDIEVANEALLRRMVTIVNVSNSFFNLFFFYLYRGKMIFCLRNHLSSFNKRQ
jgi:hypothetical protein